MLSHPPAWCESRGGLGDMASDANAEDEMQNVYALGLVSFFTDVSTEMVLSLLSVFVLGLPGSSRALLGLIEGVAESLSYGLRAVSGLARAIRCLAAI
jgi:hypothetical protein